MVDFVVLFVNFASKTRNLNFYISCRRMKYRSGMGVILYQVYTMFGTGTKNVFVRRVGALTVSSTNYIGSVQIVQAV